MGFSVSTVAPVFLLLSCVVGLALALLLAARLLRPRHVGGMGRTSYESGMDPIHDTHRRFDVRFYLLAIAFLVFDVELLFLYPWAVASPAMRDEDKQRSVVRGQWSVDGAKTQAAGQSKNPNPESADFQTRGTSSAASRADHRSLATDRFVFPGVMLFFAMLALGFIYDWRKGVFQWR
jgi:NADH-quinone oxidoreductase subunit A